MKLTTKKVQALAKAFKNGLSITLAVILMAHIGAPLRVNAATLTGSAETPETAPVGTEEAQEAISTVQDVLLDVCHEHGYDEACAKHLLGMVMQESVAKADAVGDHGASHGWFQINKYYNPSVTLDCARDLRCSAEWTLTRLERFGYAKYPNWAIWCHNGCGINKAYVPNVLRKGNAQWDTPIALESEDAPHILALTQ